MIEIMGEAGLTQCIGDPRCFKNNTVIVSTHVDDMLACGPNKELDIVEKAIERKVELDKIGLPTKLLGMELTWTNDNKRVMLTQTNAIERLTKEHVVMNEIPTKSLPLNCDFYEAPQNQKEKPQYTEITKYQSLVGSLLYIN